MTGAEVALVNTLFALSSISVRFTPPRRVNSINKRTSRMTVRMKMITGITRSFRCFFSFFIRFFLLFRRVVFLLIIISGFIILVFTLIT